MPGRVRRRTITTRRRGRPTTRRVVTMKDVGTQVNMPNRTARAILSGKLYRFRRMCAAPVFSATNITTTVNATTSCGQWSVAAGALGRFVATASLNDLQGVADFTVLFDQYKLLGIRYKIAYRYTTGDNAAAANAMPYIVYANDYDDNNIPASELQISEYSTAKKKYFTSSRREINIYVRPKLNIVVNDGTNSGGAQFPSSLHPWIDIAAPSMQHWGLKGVVFNPNSAVAAVFDVTAFYYLSFKVVR